MVDQNKKHIITIAGRPGSGKSVTSKAIAKKLGYEHFSSGDLMRALGREHGLDILQTNLAAEQRQEFDRVVDQRLQDIGAKKDKMVIDSRLAWHWIPASFKVFLHIDLEEAAKRIIKNKDAARLRNEVVPRDPHAYAQILGDRLESEARRYDTLYHANPYDINNYDFVVDTAINSIDQTVALILEQYHRWRNLPPVLPEN